MDGTSTRGYGRLTRQLHRAERSLRDGQRRPVPLSVLRQGYQEIDRLLTAMAADTADAVRAGAAPAAGIGSWTVEAARVRDALERHRFAVADVAGLLLPTTVRPASLAATGPHVAGMNFEPADPLVAPDGQPRFGVELAAVLDAVSGTSITAAAAPPVPTAEQSVAAGPRPRVPEQSERDVRHDLGTSVPLSPDGRPLVGVGA